MITYLTPYYENAGMLREQFMRLECLEADVRKQLEYIVVDDGSPKIPAREVLREHGKPFDTDFSLYRIAKDLPWNHIAARNIAVHYSKYDWLMMTDMDHVVPAETWEYLLKGIKAGTISKEKVHTFNRVDAPEFEPYKPHPHTWFFHKSVWEKFGGYDERFSGHYGMDFLARERLQEFTCLHLLPCSVIRYPREVIADASTTCYQRKMPSDRRFVKELRQKLKADGSYFKPKTMTFVHEKVYP